MKLNTIKLLKILSIASSAFLVASITACNSGDTSNDTEVNPDRFIGDAQSGSIEMVLNDDHVATTDTVGFRVLVKDKDGAPVPDIAITCDTEQGVALIDPTSGLFITDDNGQASGRMGCDHPGSHTVGCRLQAAANFRDFTTIFCEGPRPIGLNGFVGAGGQGLGGGVSEIPDTDNDFTARIASISFSEVGEENTKSIDLTQGICDQGTVDPVDDTIEPFTETMVTFTVSNDSDKLIRFTGYFYTIFNFDGNGNETTSDLINFIGEQESRPGTSTALNSLFLEDTGPVTARKRVPFAGDALSSAGFKNIEVTLVGVDVDGQEIRISARESLSLNFFNKCGV